MDFDLYNSYVEVTISRRDVEGLVGIWKETAYMGEQGDEFRELIMDSLPYLSKFYSLPQKKTLSSFKEFVEDYDEMNYEKECNDSPNFCLQYFAERGNRRNVRIAIKKGADDWNMGMTGAAIGGHAELVKFFVEKGARDWNRGMVGAAMGGHLELVKFFIEKGAVLWDWGMYYASRGGHFSEATRASGTSGVDLVEFFIEKGARDWNWGMAAAAEGGHAELVEFFIEKGAIPTDEIRRKFNL